MKSERQAAKDSINDFFSKEHFTKDEMRKIRNLAMKYRLPLKENRKKFCRFCLSQLKGSTRINSGFKTVVCEQCGKPNRFRISQAAI